MGTRYAVRAPRRMTFAPSSERGRKLWVRLAELARHGRRFAEVLLRHPDVEVTGDRQQEELALTRYRPVGDAGVPVRVERVRHEPIVVPTKLRAAELGLRQIHLRDGGSAMVAVGIGNVEQGT